MERERNVKERSKVILNDACIDALLFAEKYTGPAAYDRNERCILRFPLHLQRPVLGADPRAGARSRERRLPFGGGHDRQSPQSEASEGAPGPLRQEQCRFRRVRDAALRVLSLL